MRLRRPGRLPLLLAAALAFLAVPRAHAQYRVIETDDLRLVYPGPTLGFIAPYTARCFENSLRFHRRLFDFAPSEKVNVILDDFTDYGNAGVWASPRNSMIVHIAPANFVYETGPSNERMNFTMNHEVVHVAALDGGAGSDKLFRGLFRGKVRETAEQPETILYGYLTLPRRAAPRWYHEGIAVFLETWMAGGLGRAQGPYDEMVFRAMVRDSARFYDPLGLESEGTKVDFQVGVNSYLYGTRFMSWLAWEYGSDSLIAWVSRGTGSRGYFAGQFRHVYGRSLDDAWRDWVAWEHDFQRANLAAIREHPTTPSRDLSTTALGSVSRACLDSAKRTLYAAVNYPGTVAHIAAIPLDGGPIRKLHEVKGPALYFVSSIAWDPASRTLFYTADNNEWRDLYALDVDTGRSRRLIKDARVGDLAFNRADGSLWGVRHFNGVSSVVRLPAPWTDFHRVASWPYGQDVYDLDVSPDGARVAASVAEISGRQSLRLFPTATLAKGDTASRTLYDFGSSIPTSFVFTPDGAALYGSSYYTGVSNIFRYDLVADSMDVVTNAETGFFRPLALASDSLVVFRYSGQGFVPATIEAHPLTDVSAITFFGQALVEKRPVLKTWLAPSPATVTLDSAAMRPRAYAPLGAIRLATAYPIVQSYKDRTAVGVRLNFSDPLQIHAIDASATWSPDEGLPDDERLHASLGYKRFGMTAGLRWNPASFYDLVGPTKTSRKGYGANLGWKRLLVRDLPKTLELSAGISGWGGLERHPDFQNVATSPGFDKLVSTSASLTYKHLRSSLGAVDHEKGWQWELDATTNAVRFVRGDDAAWRGFPQGVATLDAGLPLPLRNSSVWLRSGGGYSPGDRDEPFANFFFGGFGNNVLDHQEPRRYRTVTSFPGVPLDDIAGTTFARSMLEWNLPPLRFERLGRLALYCSHARASLFAGGITTNPDDAPTTRRVGHVGAQTDFRLQLLTQSPLTLSFGWARAFERRTTPRDEWMVSLKVL